MAERRRSSSTSWTTPGSWREKSHQGTSAPPAPTPTRDLSFPAAAILFGVGLLFLGAVAYGMYWGGSHVIRALGTADVHGHSVDPQAYTCNQLHSDLDEKSGAGRDRFNLFVDAVVQQANVEQ